MVSTAARAAPAAGTVPDLWSAQRCGPECPVPPRSASFRSPDEGSRAVPLRPPMHRSLNGITGRAREPSSLVSLHASR